MDLVDEQASSQELSVDPLSVTQGEDYHFHDGDVDHAHQLCTQISRFQRPSLTDLTPPGILSSLPFAVSPGTSGEDVHLPTSGAECQELHRNNGISQNNHSEHGIEIHDHLQSYSGKNEPHFPMHASIQESCLLRYFIEELSPLVNQIPDTYHYIY